MVGRYDEDGHDDHRVDTHEIARFRRRDRSRVVPGPLVRDHHGTRPGYKQ